MAQTGSGRESNPASSAGRQTSRATSSPTAAAGPAAACCVSPEEVFGVANALAVLFAANLTQDQLQTLINLLSFLVSGLSTIVTQQQICEGVIVQQGE